jgi:hypothetical protein
VKTGQIGAKTAFGVKTRVTFHPSSPLQRYFLDQKPFYPSGFED